MINVMIDGTNPFPPLQFGNISSFMEFPSMGMTQVAVIANGNPVLQRDIMFQINKDSTLLIVGLQGANGTEALDALVLVDTYTIPTTFTKSGLRFIHVSPGTPPMDIRANGTLLFSAIAYKTATAYSEITSGTYHVEVNSAGTNQTIFNTWITVDGGSVYSLFAEGVLPNIVAKITQDYFPPPDFRLRALHSSPDAGAIDLLVNGSAKFLNVPYESASAYQSFQAGSYTFKVVPTNQINPVWVQSSASFGERTDWSYLFVGLLNTSVNHTNQHVDHILTMDDNSLPKAGDIKFRFIHASPNAPAFVLRANGVSVFHNVSYKESTNYTFVASEKYTLEIFVADAGLGAEPVFAQLFDFRAKDGGSAVYTLVAEGLYGMQPALKIVAFLDAGEGPPTDHSPTGKKGGLSGLAIGLIVGGVAIFVLLVAGLGFVFYRWRSRYSAYSEIADAKP